MNRSLKSARPDSSTYSTSRRIDSASARSRSDSAAIFAPSPATLPATTMRGSASCGTRPIRTALRRASGTAPNAARQQHLGDVADLDAELRTSVVQPVAIDALANWSSRTSRWER